MDLLRDLFDEFSRAVLESSDTRFSAGCGCLVLVVAVVLAGVFAGGLFVCWEWIE